MAAGVFRGLVLAAALLGSVGVLAGALLWFAGEVAVAAASIAAQ